MIKYIIFAGTTEGRKLSEVLSDARLQHVVCVATDIGEAAIEDNEYAKVHKGRLGSDEIGDLIVECSCEIVFDATHPYASCASENIKCACENFGVKYIRILRENSTVPNNTNDSVRTYDTFDSMVHELAKTEGNILFTTGSKNLKDIPEDIKDQIISRAYVRVLPAVESIELCNGAGIDPKRIIAMYGPFSEQMNVAQIMEHDIKHIVTKQSGSAGGFEEKVSAAFKCGACVHIIGRPAEDMGVSIDEAVKMLGLQDNKTENNTEIEISLVGTGMGTDNTMTMDASRAVLDADIIMGAPRMTDKYKGIKTVYPYYLPVDVISCLDNEIAKERGNIKRIAILFSGDSGFYSGTAKLIMALKHLDYVTVHVIPGISSVSCLAAKLGVSYSDAAVMSIHGKTSDKAYVSSVMYRILFSPSSFVLLSGKEDIRYLISELKKMVPSASAYKITIGINLTLDDERIIHISPDDDLDFLNTIPDKALCIAHIANESQMGRPIGIELHDEDFIRGLAPMTKEHIRHIVVSKLGLRENSIVYDIGAGTGSVSVEIAKQDPSIHVYAVEHKSDAVELINRNVRKFEVNNVEIIEGSAPQAIADLPVPTHVFIGGSDGNLLEIVDAIRSKNVSATIVISAVTLETAAQLSELVKQYNGELIQVQMSVAKHVGRYNLMEGYNPVYVARLN